MKRPWVPFSSSKGPLALSIALPAHLSSLPATTSAAHIGTFMPQIATAVAAL